MSLPQINLGHPISSKSRLARLSNLLWTGCVVSLLIGCRQAKEAQLPSFDDLVHEANLSRYSQQKMSDAPRFSQEQGEQSADGLSKVQTVNFQRLHPYHSPQLTVPAPLVSDTFIETDLRQAIQILAVQAGVQVIIDDSINGLTSASIDNEPFDLALDKLLTPGGFVYRFRPEDQVYLISSADPKGTMFSLISDRFEYQPLYLAAKEIVALLPERYGDYVQLLEKRNLILIEAPRRIGEEIFQFIHEVDQPVPQVMLEAMVCVFSPEHSKQFGFDINGGVQIKGLDAIRLGLSGLALSGAYNAPATADISNFSVTSSFLRALSKEGYVTIRAAPRIMAENGEKASITIARETYFSIQPNNAQSLFRQDVERVEAGISLDIIPEIRDSQITVHVLKAEVSEDIRSRDAAADLADTYPVINRRRISTKVTVSDGETIVIGGLTQRQMVDRVTRVPYLGRLPRVGKLFQQIDQQEQENEVVLFLSPTIIKEPQHR